MQMLFSIQIFTRNILTNTSFLNKSKVKFLQIKQDTTKNKCCQKHEKRCASAHVHMRRDALPPKQLRTYLVDSSTFEYRIH